MAFMTVNVSCKDLEPVRAFLEICKTIETDERIDKGIRNEYAKAFEKALEITD